jgi:hypothetical protein
MNIRLKNRQILDDLGGGLVLCRTTAEDAEPLAEFNSQIHSEEGFDNPDRRVNAHTKDLLARPHPTVHPEDGTMVIEAGSGKIISSIILISQTWAYEGIPFGVGRPELVGTLPEFRKRGLVHRQFDEIQKWSTDRGDLVQGITGIPFYYRLFGYEMGMELGGGRTGYEAQLPKLKEGEKEPFEIRPASEDDIPFLMDVYAHACQRRLVTCVRDRALWQYELTGQSNENSERMEIRILERSESSEPVGYFTHPWLAWDTGLVVNQYELKPGVSWLEVTPTVARYLWQTGENYFKRDGKTEPRKTYSFWLGSEHPSYDIFRERLPRHRDPYAWYLRVANLPAFLRVISPALEDHIAGSVIAGHSGEVKVSFYQTGLRMVLEKGRLVTIEPWMPNQTEQGETGFPGLSFLQLVFGYRTFEELEQSFADCWYKDDERRVLLNTLFPKKASAVMMVS